MEKRHLSFNLIAVIGAMGGIALLNVPLISHAADVPASFHASPDVYKFLA